jgi:hypothetical protein
LFVCLFVSFLARTPLFSPSRISPWTENSSFFIVLEIRDENGNFFRFPKVCGEITSGPIFTRFSGTAEIRRKNYGAYFRGCHIDTWTSPIQYIINIFSKTLWWFQNLSREIKPKSQTLLLCLFSTTRCGLVIVTSIRLI